MPSGVGSYILKYRNQEGWQRKLAIGRVGSITPDEARGIARDRLAEIAKGGDPSANRHAIRAAISVAELCDLYLEDAANRLKRSTLAMDRSRINCHVKPLIGSRTVIGLTTDDLERLQTDIAAGRSARARKDGRGGVVQGGRGVASRTLGMFGTILEFARRKKLISVNPSRDVIRLPEGKQERYLTTEEIGRLGATIAEMERESGYHVGLIVIRFLLTSGVRRMEALALPAHWVDTKANCIRCGDSKSARGPEGGTRIEIRPIGDSALEGVTPHVLRHSFAAMAKALGYSEFVIAGLIGHRLGGITARYGKVPDKALIAAANHISCYDGGT